MVQGLVSRLSDATKSNQHRIVKTPGGKLTYQTTKKRASRPKCPVTGKRIQGVPGEALEPNQENKLLGDPELVEDAEFYQQLLKEFFENVDPASSEAAFYAMKKFQTKKRKVVDRRASKSRKIRYNVHEKIVKAPPPAKIPPNTADLLKNLFSLKTCNVPSEA